MKRESGNIRRNRFEKIASKRVQKVLDDLDLLSNCSNKNNYEYSESDVKKMMSALRAKIKQLETSFSGQKGSGKDSFTF